jgi:hypothetical protein
VPQTLFSLLIIYVRTIFRNFQKKLLFGLSFYQQCLGHKIFRRISLEFKSSRLFFFFAVSLDQKQVAKPKSSVGTKPKSSELDPGKACLPLPKTAPASFCFARRTAALTGTGPTRSLSLLLSGARAHPHASFPSFALSHLPQRPDRARDLLPSPPTHQRIRQQNPLPSQRAYIYPRRVRPPPHTTFAPVRAHHTCESEVPGR